MEVQVITRHAVINYGSLLQAMATQKIIETLGHECKIIDYQREDEHYAQVEKTMLAGKENWKNNALKRCIYLAFRQPSSILAGKKFEQMQKKYLKLTALYTTADALKQMDKTADVYMTGSDQVWGKVTNGQYDGSYFLDFVPDNKYKIAFAASMGHAVKNAEEEQKMEQLLKRYQQIAVREDAAVDYLKGIGIDAKQVLDPTLLVSSEEWSKLAVKKEKKKYVLVYQIHSDKRVGQFAKAFAKKKGLPLIRISAYMHQMLREGKFSYLPDVQEFLGYVKNAEYMVTDSFHGTAFAINFNTQFVEVLPNTNTGSRNMSILRLTNLTDRIATEIDDMAIFDKNIDFTYANQVLATERVRSLAILKEMLSR